MSRTIAALAAVAALSVPLLAGHQPAARQAGAKSDADKIKSATSAAPESVSKNATILDWPEKEGGQPRQLRAGTNVWVCYPSTPTTMGAASGEDPMCLDKEWQQWAAAWMAKKPFTAKSVAVAYMLMGDKGASNTDPFATGATPTNQWVVSGPHTMVLVPDVKQLDTLPTDPKSGGPFVMWKGTPYAHVMVPVK